MRFLQLLHAFHPMCWKTAQCAPLSLHLCASRQLSGTKATAWRVNLAFISLFCLSLSIWRNLITRIWEERQIETGYRCISSGLVYGTTDLGMCYMEIPLLITCLPFNIGSDISSTLLLWSIILSFCKRINPSLFFSSSTLNFFFLKT